MKMTKSVAIVTGASSGIGRATALRLARDFSCVVLAARSGERLDEVAAVVKSAGAQALVVEGDLGQPKSADTVIERTLEAFGRIDALVNVAGAVPGVDVFEMNDEQWDGAMALKFHGARRLTLRAWEALKAAGGSVVFISGNAAETPKAGAAAVGAINAAIEALAKAFADRGHDRPANGHDREGGCRAECQRGRREEALPGTGGDRAIRRAGRDRRSHRLRRLAARALDDRHRPSH
jgi:3-oxoacyl-[acyl-carrier protein] reductase